ncbi:MAG: hypothetical protein QM642_09995 [Edaphocola sp.]
MINRKHLYLYFLAVVFYFLGSHCAVYGQTLLSNTGMAPSEQQNAMFQQGADSNKKAEKWKEEQAKIYFTNMESRVRHQPDSTLPTFHRFEPVQPWWGRDLGNYGTATRNQLFTPALPVGMSLGYHIYDLYTFTLDSLKYYNTTRPYSSFSFLMGSKSQQNVEILHTQNITPDWNFAGRLKYSSSPGFYKYLKANSINGSFSSNYKSKNQRYTLYLGFVYNRHKQGENGGITSDSFLTDPLYGDRQVVPVNLPGTTTSSTANGAVSNLWRRADFALQNNYSFGKTDTVYNKDSTGFGLNFTPRFRLKHQLNIHSERHIFRDLEPTETRYPMVDTSLALGTTDTLMGQQNWFYIDNRFSLNGFMGNNEHLFQIEAGIGNRIDRFSTFYMTGSEKQAASVGNYIYGTLNKESLKEGQWGLQATATLFFTGDATGNFDLKASVGKNFSKLGDLSIGFQQNLSNAPFTYNSFITNYYKISNSFGKMSTTLVWGKLDIPSIKLELYAKNYLITNFLYYGTDSQPTQQSEAFSLLQIGGRKQIQSGILQIDNEIAWQQPTANAPVHVPALLLRERIGIETPMFKSALRIATGLEARYHTAYYPDGYNPYFNQFYYQTSTKINNVPEVLAYFNFKVKSFRAYATISQLQHYLGANVMAAPGYPGPDGMFRFGFTWILIN